MQPIKLSILEISKTSTGSEATSRPGCRSRRRARNARSARRRSLLSTLARTRASVHFLSRSFPRPFLAALPVRLGVFHRRRCFHACLPWCACHERVPTRPRNPPIKTHPIACNATAPFARMRFFHRHRSDTDFRPFPRRSAFPSDHSSILCSSSMRFLLVFDIRFISHRNENFVIFPRKE